MLLTTFFNAISNNTNRLKVFITTISSRVQEKEADNDNLGNIFFPLIFSSTRSSMPWPPLTAWRSCLTETTRRSPIPSTSVSILWRHLCSSSSNLIYTLQSYPFLHNFTPFTSPFCLSLSHTLSSLPPYSFPALSVPYFFSSAVQFLLFFLFPFHSFLPRSSSLQVPLSFLLSEKVSFHFPFFPTYEQYWTF